jgi:hypothetical protein
VQAAAAAAAAAAAVGHRVKQQHKHPALLTSLKQQVM